MDLLHVALASSSEERADAFYVGLLGLEKGAPRVVPADLCRPLLGIDRALTAINYTGGAARFEVFICPGPPRPAGHVEHVCIAVGNLPELLRKCEQCKVEIVRVPKGEALITFAKDFDGNLFEIKEKL